jgi:hypothetical protein
MKKQRQRIGLMNFDAVLTEDQEDMVGKMETLKYCIGLQYNTRVRSLGWGRGRASCSWIGESVDVPVGTRLDAPQRAQTRPNLLVTTICRSRLLCQDKMLASALAAWVLHIFHFFSS